MSVLRLPLTRSYCRRQQYNNAMVFFDTLANQEWIVESYVPSAHKNYLLHQRDDHQHEATVLEEELRSGSLITNIESIRASIEPVSCLKDIFSERCV